jgi:hypothetical protein
MEYSNQCDGASDAVQTVSSAVAEITSGIFTRLSVPQSVHWDFKLTALCTWRTLATYSQFYPHDTAKYVVPQNNTIHGLPGWNLAFFFELIRANHWIQHFLQVCFTQVMLLWLFLK